MKTCTGPCGRTLPLTDFHKQSRAPDGHRPQCRECRHATRNLPAAIRAQHGLSPAERARLDAEAKAVAIRFAVAVKARDAAAIQRITTPMSREGIAALAINVAEALTDGMRLLAVTRAADDGLPEVVRAVPARLAPVASVAEPGPRKERTEALSDGEECAA